MSDGDDGRACRELTEALKQYGIAIFQYSGRGVITGNANGRVGTWPCHFSAAQLQSGQIVIACELDSSSEGTPMAIVASGFEGESLLGERITSTDLGQITTLGSEAATFEAGAWLTFRANDLDVVLPKADRDSVIEERYGVTNYAFDALEAEVLGRKVPNAIQLLLRSDASGRDVEHVVVLAQVPHYRDAVARLRTLKGIEVTTEAIFAYPSAEVGTHGYGAHDVATFDAAISALTYVMSVGAGSKVQWVYRTSHARGGDTVARSHRARIAKSFTSQAIIRNTAGTFIENKRFLERAYPAFHTWERQFRLSHLIDAYLDAKSEADFLEARGAKIAIALEALKDRFAGRPGAKVPGTRIPKAEFRKIRPKIQAAIRDILESFDIGPASIEEFTEPGALTNLNRLTFGELITGVLDEIGLTVDREELRRFVKSRNALVHVGQFECVRVAEEDELDPPKREAVVSEYLADVHLLDRILLRVLGHVGQYVDRSSSGNPKVAELSVSLGAGKQSAR